MINKIIYITLNLINNFFYLEILMKKNNFSFRLKLKLIK